MASRVAQKRGKNSKNWSILMKKNAVVWPVGLLKRGEK